MSSPAHNQLSPGEATAKIEKFCAWQERCSSEVLGKLERWGVDPDDQQQILIHLINEGFLSDERFAELFVRSKINQNKWGRIKIKAELMRRRISSETIDREIDRINEDRYRENLESLFQKKITEIKTRDQEHRDVKLKQYLYSKGYEPELIMEMIQKF